MFIYFYRKIPETNDKSSSITRRRLVCLECILSNTTKHFALSHLVTLPKCALEF